MDDALAASSAGAAYGTGSAPKTSTDNSNYSAMKKTGKSQHDVEDIIQKIRDRVRRIKPGLQGDDFDEEVIREAEAIFRKVEQRALEETSDTQSVVTVKPALRRHDGPQSNLTSLPEVESEWPRPSGSESPPMDDREDNLQSKPTERANPSQMTGSQATRHSTPLVDFQSEHPESSSFQEYQSPRRKRRGKKSDSNASQAASQSQRSTMSSGFHTNGSRGGSFGASDPSYRRGDRTLNREGQFDDDYSFNAPDTSQRPKLTLSNLEALANAPSDNGRGKRRSAWTGSSLGPRSQEQAKYQFSSRDSPSIVPSRRGASLYETQSGTRTTRDGKEAPRPPNALPLKGPYKELGESTDESDGAASDEIIKDNRYRSHWSGEARDLINKYKCHFPDCPNSQPARGFKDTQGLREHKRFCHDICEKCDMEFLDFPALLAHKQMSENHIACWSCGKDFHTAPARERHMLQVHPDLKNLECPGCGQMYQNSASFVRHVERNECRGITEDQFNKARLMITKVKDIAVVEQVEPSPQPGKVQKPPGLDVENEDDFPGLPGLDLRKKNPPHKHGSEKSKYEEPHKPVASGPGATTDLIKKLESMSTAGPLSNVAIEPHQKRLLEVYKKMIGSNHGVYEPPMKMDGTIAYEGIPDHSFYNPASFRNQFGKYNCPHAFCTKSWKNERALDNHLKSAAHKCRDFRCPECCNIFNTADAIVAHFESPSAYCNIRQSNIYKEAMEIASGSFLTASHDFFGNVKVETQEPKW